MKLTKLILISLFSLFIFTNVNARVEYVDSIKTLTVIGTTNASEIRQYSEATTLVIQDASVNNSDKEPEITENIGAKENDILFDWDDDEDTWNNE